VTKAETRFINPDTCFEKKSKELPFGQALLYNKRPNNEQKSD